jgi:uncharacterized protein with HEPN domain
MDENYIIHGYDSLRLDILWSIVINHLPILEKEVSSIMRQINDVTDNDK